jgi:hypothetical protein
LSSMLLSQYSCNMCLFESLWLSDNAREASVWRIHWYGCCWPETKYRTGVVHKISPSEFSPISLPHHTQFFITATCLDCCLYTVVSLVYISLIFVVECIFLCVSFKAAVNDPVKLRFIFFYGDLIAGEALVMSSVFGLAICL